MKSSMLNIGILAHVDAGKTTLSEALLLTAGAIRKAGRVDHGDAFLDTESLEKERGITIFSKQARFSLPFSFSDLPDSPVRCTLIDTPGHADFSPEMERTLRILDCCILIVSALDGIDNQLPVLWKLLAHYEVPTIVFVNKMDRPEADRKTLLNKLRKQFGIELLDFTDSSLPLSPVRKNTDTGTPTALPPDRAFAEFLDTSQCEELSLCEEGLLDAYLSGVPFSFGQLRELFAQRRFFPVLFGSALRFTGIEQLLRTVLLLSSPAVYPEEFGARVYKITRDDGVRLTWLKITGGSVKVRELIGTEKIDQIRLYSGSRFSSVQQLSAGETAAISGLADTRAGMGLGFEKSSSEALLQPVFSSRILLPSGYDTQTAFTQLSQLEEEEPMLHLSRSDVTGDISALIMGTVQTEILKRLAMDRFGLSIEFGPENIVYKETVAEQTEGVGHYEPLRHYSEVHLLLSPGAPGSGITVDSLCSTDTLSRNFQNLVLQVLSTEKLYGVLTGSELTDVRISLTAGRASIKHTVGGDFRQATLRAVRQGLMMARSILLEPVFEYSLEIPSIFAGRAMTDLHTRNGTCEVQAEKDGTSVLAGTVPASSLGSYAQEIRTYTGGKAVLSLTFSGYIPCINADEVIKQKGYIAAYDTEHPASSVFCSHGAGTIVPWNEVRSWMHIDTGWRPLKADSPDEEEDETAEGKAFKAKTDRTVSDNRTFKEQERDFAAAEQELIDIFEHTYGPIRKRSETSAREYESRVPRPDGPQPKTVRHPYTPPKEYLLIDGYNILYAWPELRSLAESDIKASRDRLTDIMANYAGTSPAHVIVVFDAYKVPGGRGEIIRQNNMDIIYTKEAETADLYIEKAAHEFTRKNYRVAVATSDAVEQMIIMGAGAVRLSASGLLEQVNTSLKELRDKYSL